MSDPGSTRISNGTLILPDRLVEHGTLTWRQDRIVAVEEGSTQQGNQPGKVIDAAGGFVSPGFVDLHVHGGGGADFMDGTQEAARTALRTHARHGTTSLFPTTTTGSQKQLEAMLDACQSVQAEGATSGGARIAGAHLYGPYFASSKTGCHGRAGCRAPDPAEYVPYLERGIVRIATCAAELPGAVQFYAEASRHGCLVTCGHSDASWAEMRDAFAAGMRHVDHFWCAMSSVPSIRARFGTPSQGSMEQFVLMHDEMSTEIIADGCHLAVELLEFAWVMKTATRLCLVTDANRAMDMPPGRYRFGPLSDGEWFESDGRVGFQPGGALASSVVGMDSMVRNMARLTTAGLAATVRMASLTPAERAGIAADTGSLEVGKRADVLILDHELCVQRVFIGGEEFVFPRA